MFLLTRKKADQEIKDAVSQVLLRVPDLGPQVEALRQQMQDLYAEIGALRADHAERVTELHREYDAKLEAAQEAGTENLNRALSALPAMPAYEAAEPDPRIPELQGAVSWQGDWIKQLNDTTQYLLDAPVSTHTVVQGVPAMYGVMAVAEQHQSIRPMGAR